MQVEIRFPRYIDSPPQFLIWEMDEILPVIMCFVLFLPARNPMIGLIIGVVLMKLYVKLKTQLPQNFMIHYMWFWGLWHPKTKGVLVPKGYISRYWE